MLIDDQLHIIAAALPFLGITYERVDEGTLITELRFTEGPSSPCWCLRWEPKSRCLAWWNFDSPGYGYRVAPAKSIDVLKYLFESLSSLKRAEGWPSAVSLAVYKKLLTQRLGRKKRGKK